jgi:hypothetical protein
VFPAGPFGQGVPTGSQKRYKPLRAVKMRRWHGAHNFQFHNLALSERSVSNTSPEASWTY